MSSASSFPSAPDRTFDDVPGFQPNITIGTRLCIVFLERSIIQKTFRQKPSDCLLIFRASFLRKSPVYHFRQGSYTVKLILAEFAEFPVSYCRHTYTMAATHQSDAQKFNWFVSSPKMFLIQWVQLPVPARLEITIILLWKKEQLRLGTLLSSILQSTFK